MNSNRFKLSEFDAAVGKVELQISMILTEELNARPEISPKLLMASDRVRARIKPLLQQAQNLKGGKLINYRAYAHPGDNGQRYWVSVVIE